MTRPLDMLDAAITGPALIRAGLKRLWHPSLRWLVLAPLVINLAVYAVLIGISVQWLSGWLDSLMSTVPDWLQAVVWLIWLLFAVMAMVVTAFTFNLLANLLGSPFYGLIAERVLAQERGDSADLATVSMGQVAWQSFLRQLQFLRYLLPRSLGIALLTLIVSFIPVVNLLAPVIAGLWAAWSLALQYLDYPADSDQMSFAALRQHLGANRWQSLSFGFSALLASSVPIVNLFLLPATVVGGTLLWCQQRQGVER